MNIEEQLVKTEITSSHVSELVSSILGIHSRPSDEDPLPPGPWDPVVRAMLPLYETFGPQPEPWRQAAAAIRIGDHVSLNPQPLPPRVRLVAAMGQAALSRAELIGEAAARSGHSGIAGRYMLDLIDDWCGTPPRKFPWPRPGPRPEWAAAEIGALDHLILASILKQALEGGLGGDFAEGVKAGQQKLVETAIMSLRG